MMSNLCFIWNTIPVLSEAEELYGLIITQTPKFNKKKFSTKTPPPTDFSLQETGFLCKYSNENMSDIWLRFIGPYMNEHFI
mgnify:CR=1 FL=1